MTEESGTWHYGLVARWWDEFNAPEPQEVAFYLAAIPASGNRRSMQAAGPGASCCRCWRTGWTSTGSISRRT